MSPTPPYQPALLRILHGLTAMLTVSALISGFWVYDTYDQRWGSLALPALRDIQGIHGTIGLTFLLLLPLFALYSFRLGDRRLIQAQSLSQLKQVGQPVWWVSLHRLTNTLMLLAATFAVITGRMMQEAWLPSGAVQQPWYLAHLAAWVTVLISLALHLLMGGKVGGLPLLLSMFAWKTRREDMPHTWLQEFKWQHGSVILRTIESVVIGGIILAFLLPLFNT